MQNRISLNKEDLPLSARIIVTHKTQQGSNYSNPCLEMRRAVTDEILIRKIVTAALKEIPILVLPCFTDKIKAISSLSEKGLITVNDGQPYFTF